MRIYYQSETKKALRNFSASGVGFSLLWAKNIALVKKEAARVNVELGYLDKQIGNAIKIAARELMRGKFNDQIVVDMIQGGAGTSMNMNINEVLASRATEIMKRRNNVHPLEHVNLSQSTNDVLPTALRITLLKMLDDLLDSLWKYRKEMELKADRFKDIIKVGRTHLQDAVPISLGREFGAQASAIKEDIKRLNLIKRELCRVNIGGTAVGTMVNSSSRYADTIVGRLAKSTRFPLRLDQDMVYSTQYADSFFHLSSLLAILSSNLIKFLSDLRLLASGPQAGIGEIAFPTCQKGSSIMPGKVNPVMAEMLSQIAYQVAGNNVTVFLAVQAGQLELNVMIPIIAKNLFESLKLLSNGINLFTKFGLRGIKANGERCEELLSKSKVGITALSKKIGYDKAEKLLHVSAVEKIDLDELVEREGLMSRQDFLKLLR
ncbi:aspartate ammonia-lyase [Patescibacteria group bacterium]|nr:aspartate ammonia-lyase [Patescibacteria group bacterium]